jgi:hypothetical protein
LSVRRTAVEGSVTRGKKPTGRIESHTNGVPSHKNHTSGVFYVPNGQLRFGHGGFFTGQFVARDLRSDFGDTFTLEDCGNGVVDRGRSATTDPMEAPAAARPATSALPGPRVLTATTAMVTRPVAPLASAPGTPLNCNSGNFCKVDGCERATGCTHQNKPDNTPCPDNDVCNGTEVCIGGTCTDQPDLDCDDHKACTTDTCDPVLGCQNTPVQSPTLGCPCPGGVDSHCDNGNVCDGMETCDPSHEICHPGTPLSCGTTNQCLVPSCDPTTGCVALSNSGANPPGLGTFVLPSSFCSCDANGGKTGPFTISQCILDNATTVNDLLSLANHVPAGEPLANLDSCLTYSDIDGALDALNKGFDECRSVCDCGP